MKIKLSKQEQEKTYRLLDTKEINMSIADLLFGFYEDVNAFKGCDSANQIFDKLVDLSGATEEEIPLLEKWIKPAISPLKVDFFARNPYYGLIKPKPITDKDYALEYIDFKAYQLFSLNDIEVDEKDYFLERSPVSYFKEDVPYLALSYKDTVWMSITPNEINTMEPYINEVNGDVLVLGLGLGYYPFMVSSKENVKKITIVELDQKVIDIFTKNILPLFPHKDKINIVKGDAVEYLRTNKRHYDFVFADLWHNPMDGLPLYLKLVDISKNYPNTTFQYWLEKSLIALYRRCLLTVYEESLNGFSDKNYQKANDDMDKVINSIYFKTKNVTISNYDDIYKMLLDENIKQLIKS